MEVRWKSAVRYEIRVTRRVRVAIRMGELGAVPSEAVRSTRVEQDQVCW